MRPKISRKMCPKWNCEGFWIQNNLQPSLSRVMWSLILLLKPSSDTAMAPSAPSYFGAYRRFSVAALHRRARFARTGHTWLLRRRIDKIVTLKSFWIQFSASYFVSKSGKLRPCNTNCISKAHVFFHCILDRCRSNIGMKNPFFAIITCLFLTWAVEAIDVSSSK